MRHCASRHRRTVQWHILAASSGSTIAKEAHATVANQCPSRHTLLADSGKLLKLAALQSLWHLLSVPCEGGGCRATVLPSHGTLVFMALKAKDCIAAVVVTHNRIELLAASLEKVAQQEDARVEHIIVVDNGADPRVEALLSDIAGQRAVYIPSRTNLGGAGGFALGFLSALALGVDAVWCADDDGRPADQHVLATLLDVATHHGLEEVSPVVCTIDDPSQLAFPLRQGLVWRRRVDELEGDFIPGIASLFNGALISARAMERIGVPDYRLFIRGDEVEYHRRLVRSGLPFGTSLQTAYLHPDGSEEFRPILGGRMHTQFPDNAVKRFFTYRNRGYIMNQPGMRKLLPQEYARFAWFFLVQRRDVRGFRQWLSLHAMGRAERFERPEGF